MKLIRALYTLDGVVELTGYSRYWISLLVKEQRIPRVSDSPVRFSVSEMNAWATPERLERYSEGRPGFFEDRSRPKHSKF